MQCVCVDFCVRACKRPVCAEPMTDVLATAMLTALDEEAGFWDGTNN